MAGSRFAGTVAALVAVYVTAHHTGPAYSSLILNDHFSVFVHAIVIGAAALAILGSIDYLEGEGIQRGEYYALVLFAAAGMGILAGANELVTAFVGLEMSSISSYILAGFRRRALKSNESSLKYFILGSFATAFFLYGIAMVYGATGTTRLDLVQNALLEAGRIPGTRDTRPRPDLCRPRHSRWSLRRSRFTRQTSTKARQRPSRRLLASAPKAATFALMLRIFYVSFGSASEYWFWAIWVSAILTMFIGNLAALVQSNVKRMLAYSSIAHAGYILVAFAASTDLGIAAVLFYLAAYALMKVGAFLVIAHLGQRGEKHLDIKDYAGLGMRQPALAACFSLFLFSLLGLPATGGFLGKFFAFQSALDSAPTSGHSSWMVWLVVIAAINSVIGAYYYLRVIIAMYFWEQSKDYTPAPVAPALTFALALAAAGTIYLGVLPARVLTLAQLAAHSLSLR